MNQTSKTETKITTRIIRDEDGNEEVVEEEEITETVIEEEYLEEEDQQIDESNYEKGSYEQYEGKGRKGIVYNTIKERYGNFGEKNEGEDEQVELHSNRKAKHTNKKVGKRKTVVEEDAEGYSEQEGDDDDQRMRSAERLDEHLRTPHRIK
jgi:hypothetical protein